MDKEFFLNPQDPMQRRYEALRASVVEGMTAEDVARKFGYSVHTVYCLRRDFKSGALGDFFRPLRKGPRQTRSKTLACRDRIIALRKQNYSLEEIEEVLGREGSLISTKTIHLILKSEGFGRLFRRTHAERKTALQQAKNPTELANVEEFATHPKVKTAYGGIFLFIPLLLDLKLHTLFNQSQFYGSKQIPNINYLMSFLALKLLGKQRLSHVDDFNFDYGLGSFAGLNVLPKAASMTQYSYRNPHRLVVQLLKEFNLTLKQKEYLQGRYINLDFHAIPHWGEESQLERHWIPTRGKAMKSVLSFFAQDLQTTYLCYSNGQLSKAEVADEILQFASFFHQSHGKYPQYLVFDSKLTTYENLNVLDKELGIKFITLRRRGKNLLQKIDQITSWQTIRLNIPKRKYKILRICEEAIHLKDYQGTLRQIIVTNTGRQLPMCLITNDWDLPAKTIIETYAHRNLIENNLQENIDFFSLNALSSPVIVKVDFDIAITLIANTLYKALASKFKLFEKAKPKTIYRNLIEGKATIRITDDKVEVTYSKKAFNPMIMNWVASLPPIQVPWMQNKFLAFSFE
jgi:transposase